MMNKNETLHNTLIVMGQNRVWALFRNGDGRDLASLQSFRNGFNDFLGLVFVQPRLATFLVTNVICRVLNSHVYGDLSVLIALALMALSHSGMSNLQHESSEWGLLQVR